LGFSNAPCARAREEKTFLDFFGRHASCHTSPHSKNLFKTASFDALFALNRQKVIQCGDLIRRVMPCASDCPASGCCVMRYPDSANFRPELRGKVRGNFSVPPNL
jgi:hypothetical protein